MQRANYLVWPSPYISCLGGCVVGCLEVCRQVLRGVLRVRRRRVLGCLEGSRALGCSPAWRVLEGCSRAWSACLGACKHKILGGEYKTESNSSFIRNQFLRLLFGKIAQVLKLRCKIKIHTPYKIFPKTFKLMCIRRAPAPYKEHPSHYIQLYTSS